VSAVKLTELTAAIVKSGAAEVVNLNVAVALCLIPPEVPKIVTSMGVHERSAGRGRSERATVPLKPLIGFTRMLAVAKVVPSAGTILG